MRTNWKYYIMYLLVAVVVFPFLFLFFLSMSSEWRFPNVLPSYFGWRHWRDVFSSETGLITSFFISVFISLSVATSATFIGFLVSRIIAYHSKKRFFTLLTYFPYILAPVVFAACLNYFFLKLGLFGKVSGVFLAQFMIAFPYALIFFSSFWGVKTKDYEELVATLGGSKVQAYIKVLFPIAKSMLLICFFQTFLISWFEYGMTSIIGVGKVQTLTIKVFLFIKESNFYYGALSSCMLVIPPIVLLYFNKRYLFNKLM